MRACRSIAHVRGIGHRRLFFGFSSACCVLLCTCLARVVPGLNLQRLLSPSHSCVLVCLRIVRVFWCAFASFMAAPTDAEVAARAAVLAE